MRETQPVHSEPEDRGGMRDTHPAFGVAVLTRSQVTPGAVLFQSDLRHRETITLSIRTAERVRDLAHDWVHPREVIAEVQMSLAQWGALVSAIGMGSGVPVTIRATESDHTVPDLPYQPRLRESITEVREQGARLVEKAEATLTDLEAAIATGRIGAIKQAMAAHKIVFDHLESNSEFYVKSMQEAAEKVVSNARADIEAHILGSQRLVGSASIEAPEVPILEVES